MMYDLVATEPKTSGQIFTNLVLYPTCWLSVLFRLQIRSWDSSGYPSVWVSAIMLIEMTIQRTALITGGAKRVGRAIAQRLAKDGFHVAITYNSGKADAQALADEIGGIAIQADLTKPESAINQIADALRSFDRLDVLVNNASLFEPTPLANIDLGLPRQFMAIHYESPLLLCKLFADRLRSSRGHVINMVDAMIERPMPKYLAYCASKAALWNLTLSLARELAPEVTVNGIAPGVVEWPPNYPQDEKDKIMKRTPLGRVGSPTDVAETVHFLATTGTYITGQIIRLDGGRSIA
jgi:pteridine reductase